jgi:RNA processing factor Prp31
MSLVPKLPLSIDKLYQQINELSAEIKLQTINAEYELSDHTLTQRLALLKELAEQLSTFSRESSEYYTYLEFLQNLKESDDEEITDLLKERVKVIAENAQQKKRTKAVNIYHRVSLDI